MALSVYLYQKNMGDGEGQEFIDGILAALYTVDPALSPSDTTAERKALVEAAVGTLIGKTMPSGYFGTEQLLGAASGGVMADDADLVVITKHEIKKSGVA